MTVAGFAFYADGKGITKFPNFSKLRKLDDWVSATRSPRQAWDD
jgi:hypothetical protein